MKLKVAEIYNKILELEAEIEQLKNSIAKLDATEDGLAVKCLHSRLAELKNNRENILIQVVDVEMEKGDTKR